MGPHMKKKTENRPKGKKKKKRFDWLSLILFFIVLIGAAIIAYPTVSDWWNSFHQSRAIATYANIVENTSQEEMEKMLEDARVYNVKLQSTPNRFKMDEKDLEEYNSLLNLTGTGVMGYLTIQKIDVRLPLYHGTDETVLQRAIGHIEGTSLPVGGKGTHCVVSGHRGLPGARLLTDLDLMQVGDTFFLTVLNHTFTYQVDQIKVVLPSEMEELEIDPEKDYVTLVTCTPYGINTHRMLVRGHRIPNPQGAADASGEAHRISTKQVVPVALIPTAILLLLIGFFLPGSRAKLTSIADVEEALEMMKDKRRRRR